MHQAYKAGKSKLYVLFHYIDNRVVCLKKQYKSSLPLISQNDLGVKI